jgi:predicted RNA binding protein YcfA (HicA-like mRNA interferase family)
VTAGLPAITGKQLIRLLRLDGWQVARKANHGQSLTKVFPDGTTRVTVVPDKRSVLPPGTLGAILGPKQTGLGRSGLNRLIDLHGLGKKGGSTR